MDIVSKETAQSLVEGGKSIANIMAGTTSELANEAINLFIVESGLSILKFGVIFVIFMIVKKYCDAMAEANASNVGLFKALKTTALVCSLIYFTTQSYPHIIQISKALVAPKIFLLEKAAELVKK